MNCRCIKQDRSNYQLNAGATKIYRDRPLWCCLTGRSSPVANVYHQDQETFVVYLIEDAIITDANSPASLPLSF